MLLWTKRKYQRTKIKLPIGLDLGGGTGKRGMVRQTKDISARGVFVLSPDQATVGTRMFCRIILPSQKRISVPGTIWRTTPHGMALKFDREHPAIHAELHPDEDPNRSNRKLIQGPAESNGGEDILNDFEHPCTEKTVLVLEHDAANVRELCNMLGRSGYRFRVERNGKRGLNYLNANKANVGIVIVNPTMPGVKRTALLSMLKRISPDVPRLLLCGTGETRTVDPGESVLAGPFKATQLLEEIASALFINRRLSAHHHFQALCNP